MNKNILRNKKRNINISKIRYFFDILDKKMNI